MSSVDAVTLIDEWCAWMHSGGMSSRTVVARRQLVQRLGRDCDPVTCDWRALARFLAGATLAPGTRATYRADLRQ